MVIIITQMDKVHKSFRLGLNVFEGVNISRNYRPKTRTDHKES